MPHEHEHKTKASTTPYTVEDAIKIADEIFKLSKDKNYKLGAFIHGLIFALEYAQYSFKIPQQQMANIKRDCRKYFKAIDFKKS
ncbi:MAG: hypothetical protein AYK22_00455 [Thermoplasmatales archaeon SG8-52-3]|nr:MAG: hypothetical protein AYK22_00455 [Thermoplasmatales archaeon SG8-52-3]